MKTSIATFSVIVALATCCFSQTSAQEAASFELRGVTAYIPDDGEEPAAEKSYMNVVKK